MPRKYCGFLALQESMQVNGQQMPHPSQGFMVSSSPQAHNVFSTCDNVRKSDAPVSFLDCHGKAEVTKNTSDKDSFCMVGEHVDGNDEREKEKRESPRQRVKWTDQMVKLLITAVSYIGEDAFLDFDGWGRRISPQLPKKGMWKAISKVMAERGYRASPQQCEDKFNDLNKRYKKLNDILGRGTSCEIVENSALLDLMDMSDKAKESIRKILCSKQLFYREMCSYHNGNQLYIPHDQAIQTSLQLALISGDDPDFHEAKAYRSDGVDGEEEIEASDCPNDNTKEKHTLNKDLGTTRVLDNRKKPAEHDCSKSGYILNFEGATKICSPHDHARMNQVSGEGVDGEKQGSKWLISRNLQLKEQKLQIEAEMLELKKQRLRWLRSRELEDRDLEKMRLENEYLKLENERLALEINRRQTGGRAN